MLSNSPKGRGHTAASVQKNSKTNPTDCIPQKKIKILLISKMRINIVSHCVETQLQMQCFFMKSCHFSLPSTFIHGQRSPPAWGYTRPTLASRHLSPRSPRTLISQSTCCLVSKTWVRQRSRSPSLRSTMVGNGWDWSAYSAVYPSKPAVRIGQQ